jgi:uncharacterized protein YneF (UPF0154 family)
MDAEAFAILLGITLFITGVAMGLYLATSRYEPIQKGRPVSERRLRQLLIIDPLLDGKQLQRHHPTISPKD